MFERGEQADNRFLHAGRRRGGIRKLGLIVVRFPAAPGKVGNYDGSDDKDDP